MTPLLAALLLAQGTWFEIGSPCPSTDGIFGAEVVVLDFNGDGHQDLAVGAPGQGTVFLYFGPLGACAPGGSQNPPLDWQAIVPGPLPARNTCPTKGTLGFGSGLAAGDLDGVLGDELLIGQPGARVTVGGTQYLGAGRILVYTYDATVPSRVRLLTTLASNAPQANEGLGGSIAVGHFDTGADGSLDVAAGASAYSDASGCAPGPNAPGRIHVFYDSLALQAVLGNPLHLPGTTDEACNGSYGAALKSALNASDTHDLFVGAQGNPDGVHRDGGSVHVLYSPFVGLSSPGSTVVHDVNPLPHCPPPANPPPPACRELGARYSKSLAARHFQVRPERPWTTALTVGAPRKDVIDSSSGSPLCQPECVPCGSQAEYYLEVGGAFVYSGASFQIGRQLDPSLDPGYSLACNQLIGFQTTIADLIDDGVPDLVFACNGRREIMVWPFLPSGSMEVFAAPGPTGYYLGMTHGQLDQTNVKEEVVVGDVRFPDIAVQNGRVLILCVQ